MNALTWVITTLLCGVIGAFSASANADQTINYLSFATEDEANTTEVFQRASPAVVFVTSSELRRQRFSRNIMEIPRGAGSGFIWDAAAGLIVTNYHVVAGADRLAITLRNEQQYAAEVVGLAPERDLAVLRMITPPDGLTSLPLGDSSELSVGRKVMAIGNPFGLDTTLTVGVVSALDREIQSPSNRVIRGVIQTDAAINPGNSGGPLLNSLGQLIGVNTAIYSPSGGSAGIGFAIPVNTVIEVVPQLIAYGKIMRPVLGVELASDRWLRQFRVEGVPIVRTYRGFPAESVGMIGARRGDRGEIILGDVITHIEGNPVTSNDEFLTAMEQHRVGDTIAVTTLRFGEQKRFTIELSNAQ